MFVCAPITKIPPTARLAAEKANKKPRSRRPKCRAKLAIRLTGVQYQEEKMSNESDAPDVVSMENPVTERSVAAEHPRRIRLVKAMAAAGRAKEARISTATSQQFHSRTCKFSQDDEVRLDVLKRRLGSHGIRVKKGELLRAALWVLADLDEGRLREAVCALGEDARSTSGQSN
jgi:hypothetical protein